ncbi:MAG: PilT/PilU family type 4a pilus ATPase [Acidimicrobiia bacterium]
MSPDRRNENRGDADRRQFADPDLSGLLARVVEMGASDLHIKMGRPATVRVDGRLTPLRGSPLTESEVAEIAELIMPEFRRDAFATRGEIDFAHEVPGVGRFRVNVFRQQGTIAIAIRYVLPTVPTLADLGLPAVLSRMVEETSGLILVTGSTGSGKTTTLASMVEHINHTRDAHIVTIEDPVEIRHQEDRCLISQREIGSDTDSFRSALKMVLRQDPDVILIGEMRDAETVWAALAAAETGHLVLASLHTTTATETVNRILDFFPAAHHGQVRASLAGSLRGVVGQRLVPRADLEGRVPIVETLVATGRVFDRIIDAERTHELEEVIRDGSYYGMQLFDQAALALYQAGTITRHVALAAATRPHDLALMMHREAA